jgi:ATP-dependent helicase/nuclease subunit B
MDWNLPQALALSDPWSQIPGITPDVNRMAKAQLHIPPSADFWPALVRHLTRDEGFLARHGPSGRRAGVRIIVPCISQAEQLRAAWLMQAPGAFPAPQVTTLPAWLDTMSPHSGVVQADSASERLMNLYAELRRHGWLKKLFTAKRNSDLLPLAQTLLCLFDELSHALAPMLHAASGTPDEELDARWQAAMAQLPAPSRHLLSDEAQLVWTLWKSQLSTSDSIAHCHARMLLLAAKSRCPLVWISANQPDAFHQSFLDAYAVHSPVLQVSLDWRHPAIEPVFSVSWPEIVQCEDGGEDDRSAEAQAQAEAEAAWPQPPRHDIDFPQHVFLSPASSLEQEAVAGAQTVIDWLQSGCRSIAIVAQDRAVARRISALLERAEVFVTDETGWKLSTTRAAAAIASLFEVAATRADTPVLLDLLKSPCLFADLPDKMERVIAIEHALRRQDVHGGWDAVAHAVRDDAPSAMLVERLARQARLFSGRMSLCEWAVLTRGALDALGMREALASDAAGMRVNALLDALIEECHQVTHSFSLAEWRTFLGMRFEATSFVPSDFDRRVMMLQLNGMRLRSFDAVLVVGADARHLPSQLDETLFFGNAVRRELGLPTREQRQCQQLRDFTEMLCKAGTVVLSWQTTRQGEANPLSNWVQRLQLALEMHGRPRLDMHHAALPVRRLTTSLPVRPAPTAPHLLPGKLSASAYNILVACPYQFFATRMLGLGSLDELSDLPEKRDYGGWLHEILNDYHQAVRDGKYAAAARESLLREISERVFAHSLDRSAAALGYHARWQKLIPAYIEWANAREAQGWTFVDGEKTYTRIVTWEGGNVTLSGCIDRIDENADGQRAILDYKARSANALKERMREGEDHQLAFYALLFDQPVAAAHVVALDGSKGRMEDVELKNLDAWQGQLERQLVDIMQGIRQGEPLSALGIEKVCVYCEVRGLCRKGTWE